MAESMRRPQLVAPRSAPALDIVRNVAGSFDADAYHVMNERDNALIADEVLHGAGSSTFVYNFEIQGKQVAGISVVGARHLAAHYKGLQHRIVASMEKIGPVFTFTAYPGEHPMSVSCSVVAELAGEPDFYAAVVEMTDLKTGNKIQTERREARLEQRRDGSTYERPNYATIAQSKAYRNAILTLIPQDIVIMWREQMLKLKKSETITASVLDEKRSNVLRFAAQRALADAGLRRIAVGVHPEELLVGSFSDIAGETSDDCVVESTGVPHRREAALEGGGSHCTSWSNTGWDAGSSSSSATLRCRAISP